MRLILDDIFGFKIYGAFTLLKSRVFAEFYNANYEVNFEQWIILNRLWDSDGLSQGELFSLVTQSKGNLARTLKKMESDHLVRRKVNPLDQRSQLIYLTKKSKQLKEPLRKIAFEVISLSLKGVKAEELDIATKVLDQVSYNLKGKKDE